MKIGFIGCGNMGGALAVCAAKAPGNQIYLNDKDTDKAMALAESLSAEVLGITELAESCQMIFLGVKPQFMASMLEEIRDTLAKRKDRFLLISMAAGLSISKIKGMAGDYPIIRIMPNLAVSVGEGMVLYCREDVSEDELSSFLKIMDFSGKLCPLPEELIDAGSAISGCGPAYAFLFMEALADGGVACGLPRAQAQLLAAQTLLGAAKLLQKSGKQPGELKDAVCSPGGSTIAGVLKLEESGFRAAAADAVLAAYRRTLELGK